MPTLPRQTIIQWGALASVDERTVRKFLQGGAVRIAVAVRLFEAARQLGIDVADVRREIG